MRAILFMFGEEIYLESVKKSHDEVKSYNVDFLRFYYRSLIILFVVK